MKRFRSPLQRFHQIAIQQTRIAQLELLQRQAEYQQARRREDAALQAHRQAEDTLERTLRQPKPSTVIRGLQGHLAAAAERLHVVREQVQVSQQAMELAREEFQSRQSREDGLARVIETQRDVHRQEMLKKQQNVMDDVSASRWRLPESEAVSHG